MCRLIGVYALLLGSATAAAQQANVVRGRIVTDSGSALPSAEVFVTSAGSAETVRGKSDANGDFRVAITRPVGEYVVVIHALGYQPFRRRVSIGPGEQEAIVNAQLVRDIPIVALVRVQARRLRPARSLMDAGPPTTDGTDRIAEGVSGVLPPDQKGNLDALATLVPGLTATAAGAAAFGLVGDANAATLNGLAFGGADLPRDLRVGIRFRTSPWDPSFGGFSGFQTAVTLSPGQNITSRLGRVTLDAPALQFSDPVGKKLGQEYTNVALDAGGVGAYVLDRWWYNYGVNFTRRTSSLPSVFDLGSDVLARSGISLDSAQHLRSLLGQLQIPVIAGTGHDERRSTSGVFMERIDLVPRAAPAGAPPAPIAAAAIFARLSQSEALGIGPTQVASSAADSWSASGGIQLMSSRYLGVDGTLSSETTMGLSADHSQTRPSVRLPAGSVVISSEAGLADLMFGGYAGAAVDATTFTWEMVNQEAFFLAGRPSFPMKIYVQSRFDAFTNTTAMSDLGRFSFASLEDLAAGQPTRFSRTLVSPAQHGGEWIGAASAGGSWIHSGLSVTGGLRLDANAFTRAPEFNPDVRAAFGASTDYVPNRLALSPRLGFSWRPESWSSSFVNNPMATYNRGWSSVRGGIGEFRSTLRPSLLSEGSKTGLPNGVRELTCIGDAAPMPNWHEYVVNEATVPSSCRTAAATFADSAEPVALFDRSFRPSESWRANLGWTQSDLLRTYLSIDATYSLSLHQPGISDLNFSGNPRFLLVSEANRPVFVGPASILASTGAALNAASRINGAFSQVVQRVSDLRSDARQMTISAVPRIGPQSDVVLVSYTFADVRSQARGFDGNTAGDPRAPEWAPSALSARHQFTVQYSHLFLNGDLGVSTALRASSGFHFTPMVGGDVNGDGLTNDRAFIFDPTVAPGAFVGEDLSRLLQHGPRSVRDCLGTQLGQVARRNSCSGPSFATMNGNIALLNVPRTDQRARAYLSFTNITAGVDQLLHGSERLHGWGVPIVPDPTLYQVRGFDPTTGAFKYQVNPRFGAPLSASSSRLSPFRITLEFQMELGRSTAEQFLEQRLRMRPALISTRASVDTIKARYLRSEFSDIYGIILRLADSLALSRTQTEQIQLQRARLRTQADQIYQGLAEYLAALPPDYSRKAALQRSAATNDAMWALIYREVPPFLAETLSPAQVVLLPSFVRLLVTKPGYRGRQVYGSP
jgi:hypothetical protein